MKKLLILCFVLIMMLVPALLCASSCDSGGEGEDFYIKFTLDGQEYVLTLGYSDGSTDAPVVALQAINDTQDGILIYGTNWEEGGETSGILADFLGSLLPYVQGEYLGDFTLDEVNGLTSIYVGYGYLGFEIFDIPDLYIYDATGRTLTITTFGDVGGAVEGTFNVTVTYMVPLASLQTSNY